MPVPVLNIDWNVKLVDGAGVAFGTLTNPLNAQITGAGSGGTSAVDASAWTTAVSAFTPGGGVFNDSAAALTSGQQGTLRLTAARGAHTNLRTTAGADALLTNNGAAPGALTNLGVLPAIANAAVPAWTEGRQVLHSVNLDGVQRVMSGYANGVAIVNENPTLLGAIHSDASKRIIGNSPANVNSNGVNLLGAGQFRLAAAMGADPSAATAGNYAGLIANRHLVPWFIGGHPNTKCFAVQYTTAQTDAPIISVSAGNKIVVTGFLIDCSNANTANVSARLGFGTATTPAYGSQQLLGTHPGMGPGSGFGRGGGTGVIGTGADDEDIRFTCSAPTSGAVDVMVSYHVLPS
jgi:hypothetical protein